MIDHLLNFPNEDSAAHNPVLAPFYEEGAWRGDVVIPGVSVSRVTGTEIITPPEDGAPPYEQEIREPKPGWFLLIALAELSPELRDIKPDRCILIADRDAAGRGEPDFLLYLSSTWTQADLDESRVEPLFAGVGYPFRMAKLRYRPPVKSQ